MAIDVPEKTHKLSLMLAEIRRTLRRQKLCRSATIQVSESANGTIAEIVSKPGGGTPGKISQYRVHLMENDYLICQKISGTSVTGLVFIAKPFHLRRTPFDNQNVIYPIESPAGNYTVSIHYVYSSPTFRNASIGGQSEAQTVIPRFALDRDIIYAAEVEEDIGILDPNGESITLVDLNADGRAWAKVL